MDRNEPTTLKGPELGIQDIELLPSKIQQADISDRLAQRSADGKNGSA